MFDRLDSLYKAIVVKKKTDGERIIDDISNEAELFANMNDAIEAAPNDNIRRQLQYRLDKGLFKYNDLIDPEEVRRYHNSEIRDVKV